MKKILLATAGLAFAGAAFANPAAASEKIALSVGGFMYQMVGYADDDGNVNQVNFDTQSNTEVHAKGSTTLDNGLTVSAKIELEGDNDAGGTADQSFLTIGGDFGSVTVGSVQSFAYRSQIWAPDVGIGGMGQSLYFITNFGGVNPDIQNMDDKSNKIEYVSPNFSGFQIGATYDPDIASRNVLSAADGINLPADDNGYFEIGASYSGEYEGGTAVGANISYQDDQMNGDILSLGLSVGMSGFTVSGGYSNYDNSATTGFDGNAWTLGVSYGQGPWGVSLAYSQVDPSGSSNDADEWAVSGKYQLGAGVKSFATLSMTDDDATSMDGYALVGGVVLSF